MIFKTQRLTILFLIIIYVSSISIKGSLNLLEKEIDESSKLNTYIETVGNRISKGKYDLVEETKQKFGDSSFFLNNLSQGEFLGMLVKLTGARKALEVGTYTGYSALCIAEALPKDGKLITLDNNKEYTTLAKKHWKLNGVEDKIELNVGSALDSLDALVRNESNLETFDFINIDADKINDLKYYERALKLLKHGGLIVFDDTLLGDASDDLNLPPDVLKTPDKNYGIGTKEFNKFLHSDGRVDINMLYMGRGSTLIRKR